MKARAQPKREGNPKTRTFAGDIQGYGENFYETYAEYPGLIVSIPGNHDCQPDDPQDGPVDPNKKPLDGWV